MIPPANTQPTSNYTPGELVFSESRLEMMHNSSPTQCGESALRTGMFAFTDVGSELLPIAEGHPIPSSATTEAGQSQQFLMSSASPMTLLDISAAGVAVNSPCMLPYRFVNMTTPTPPPPPPQPALNTSHLQMVLNKTGSTPSFSLGYNNSSTQFDASDVFFVQDYNTSTSPVAYAMVPASSSPPHVQSTRGPTVASVPMDAQVQGGYMMYPAMMPVMRGSTFLPYTLEHMPRNTMQMAGPMIRPAITGPPMGMPPVHSREEALSPRGCGRSVWNGSRARLPTGRHNRGCNAHGAFMHTKCSYHSYKWISERQVEHHDGHVLPVFIQMFPCELRDQAVAILNRVIEATCGPAMGTVIGTEPRSDTSFIAMISTREIFQLIYRLRCRVLMDRLGFWYAENMDQYKLMKAYCESVRRLPQQARHFQTDGLPCMPLVVELSKRVHPSSIVCSPAPPTFDAVLPIVTVERHPAFPVASECNSSESSSPLTMSITNASTVQTTSSYANPPAALMPPGYSGNQDCNLKGQQQ